MKEYLTKEHFMVDGPYDIIEHMKHVFQCVKDKSINQSDPNYKQFLDDWAIFQNLEEDFLNYVLNNNSVNRKVLPELLELATVNELATMFNGRYFSVSEKETLEDALDIEYDTDELIDLLSNKFLTTSDKNKLKRELYMDDDCEFEPIGENM